MEYSAGPVFISHARCDGRAFAEAFEGRLEAAGIRSWRDSRVLRPHAPRDRLCDANSGREIARIALDAAVVALAVHGGAIAPGDGLGRIHVFDADAFLFAGGPADA